MGKHMTSDIIWREYELMFTLDVHKLHMAGTAAWAESVEARFSARSAASWWAFGA